MTTSQQIKKNVFQKLPSWVNALYDIIASSLTDSWKYVITYMIFALKLLELYTSMTADEI